MGQDRKGDVNSQVFTILSSPVPGKPKRGAGGLRKSQQKHGMGATDIIKENLMNTDSVPCTTLRIHPNVSGVSQQH